MQPHQLKVVEEKEILEVKLRKLNEFMEGAVFAGLEEREQGLLKKQALIMSDYVGVLVERIGQWKGE